MESSLATFSGAATQSSSNVAAQSSRFTALTCQICGKIFSRKDALTRHKTVHSGEKNFLCQICGKAFAQKCDMKRHEKIHASKSEELLKCDRCGKKFSRKGNLVQHQKIHILKSDELFKCNQCDKVFTGKRGLLHHLEVIHPIEPLVSVKRKLPNSSTASKRVKRSNEVFSSQTFYPHEGEEHDLDIFQTGLRPRLQEFL